MDELTLMWQSAPGRRSEEQAVPENWFGQVPDLQVVTEVRHDDAGEVPLERLEARICSLAGRLAASTCEWLRLIAEFERRKGWAQWGVVSCATGCHGHARWRSALPGSTCGWRPLW